MPYDPIDSIPVFAFWRDGVAAMARNARTLLQLAGQPVTLANVAHLVESVPITPYDLESPQWQAGYCNQCLKIAYETQGEQATRPLMDYFLGYITYRSRESQHMLIDAFTAFAKGMED
jgi:hypothetical protein